MDFPVWLFSVPSVCSCRDWGFKLIGAPAYSFLPVKWGRNKHKFDEPATLERKQKPKTEKGKSG